MYDGRFTAGRPNSSGGGRWGDYSGESGYGNQYLLGDESGNMESYRMGENDVIGMHDDDDESHYHSSGDGTPDLLHLCANAKAPTPSGTGGGNGGVDGGGVDGDLAHDFRQSWHLVREYMQSKDNDEVNRQQLRDAALMRGESALTALHFACRNQAPYDIIAFLVKIAPETVQSPDNFGWLPLHYACACGASLEVIRALAESYPDSKTTVDRRGRTPLHFAISNQRVNPEQMADAPTIVSILSSTGAAVYQDDGGMTPLHYACAVGVSEEVLDVLTNAKQQAINIPDNNSRTPLHFALSNAARDDSPGAVAHILDLDAKLASNKSGGLTPLRVLAEFARTLKKSKNSDKERENVSQCLVVLLKANPDPTADFLTALQSLPPWLSERAVVIPSVQIILNSKIAQRFPSFVLMLDFFILAMIIICFSFNVMGSIKQRFGDGEDVNPDPTRFLIPLYTGASYFLVRLIIQVVALMALKSFHIWLYDPSNWLNVIFIILVFFFSYLSATDKGDNGQFRTGAAFIVGILWLKFLGFLRRLLIDFAVFVSGVAYIFRRLFAFLTALMIILVCFSQMFLTVFQQTAYCTGRIDKKDLSEIKCGEDEDRYFCDFWSSFLRVYTMLLGEVDEMDFEDSNFATALFVVFMFLVVILLANVLIAIVTDSYKVVQNQRAAIVFWTNRLAFIAEMDAIANGPWKNNLKRAFGLGTDREDDGRTEIIYGRETWKRLMDFFEEDTMDDDGGNPFSRRLEMFIKLLVALVFIPAWIIIGFVTVGWLWPPQIREAIFTSTVDKHGSESKREDELRKTQVANLQTEVTELADQFSKEIKHERTHIVQMKSSIADRRQEIASEMKHIKRIMAMLFEQQSSFDR